MWYVYIVECADGTLYTGISNDVNKRIEKHNSGKGAKYTRSRTPVVLKWSCEAENRSEASKLEYKIKKLTRKKKLELIKMGNLQNITKQIVKVINEGTNDYDIYDDILKILKSEFDNDINEINDE